MKKIIIAKTKYSDYNDDIGEYLSKSISSDEEWTEVTDEEYYSISALVSQENSYSYRSNERFLVLEKYDPQNLIKELQKRAAHRVEQDKVLKDKERKRQESLAKNKEKRLRDKAEKIKKELDALSV